MRIQINMIKVKPGRRAAVRENIEELSKSILEVGLLNPVTVDRDNTLIAGLHRLEAVKLLGWTEIECTVSSLEGLQAELAELDENFVRSDLSTVEYGELLLRRKEIYETLHPETKNGAAQAAGMNRAIGKHVSGTMPLTSKSFTADTSEKLGVSRTTIERQIRIAKNLTPEAKELITEFVKKFYQEIEWFHIPYYEGVFPILSQAQLDYFRQQMDALHTAVDQLSNHVMKGKGKVHEQKK